MTELKETYRKVYDELLGARVGKFSHVHSPRKRYFLIATNIAESMNSCLLEVRKLPITSMAEFIRDLLPRWFYNRQTYAREMSIYLTMFADEHIKDRTEIAHRCEIHPIHFNTFKALASDFYTTGFLKHAYEMGVNPVPNLEYWDIPDGIRTCTVLPWQKKNLSGRPKKLRIPSAGEKRKLQSCSKCGNK
ncbi:hypothetical protein Dsin_029146 [Dipteronia sinensis]|uniref:Uncharacterized protein n=1 Tax=Dipteronia sinensis TaxID=43782 RepID=A0AAD9ZRX2_9ROSI|nr:hypothetical protein Dsin_029146 [Dipteronia sinensis]